MAYRLERFGDITLPNNMVTEDLDPIEALDEIVQTTSGAYDNNGHGRAAPKLPHPLSYSALVVSDDPDVYRATIDTLRVAVGTDAKLYRRAENNGAIHWCYARLRKAPHRRKIENTNNIQIRLDFWQKSRWCGGQHEGWLLDEGIYLDDGRYFDETSATFTISAGGVTFTTPLSNDGDFPTHDVTITVTAIGGSITDLTLINDTTTCIIHWAGTLAAGQSLTIDGGAYAFLHGGVAAYTEFQLVRPYHTNPWPWELAAGSNTLRIIKVGAGSMTVHFAFSDGWA